MKTRMNVVLVLASVMAGGVFAMDATDGLVGWWRVKPAEDGTTMTTDGIYDIMNAGKTADEVNHMTVSAGEGEPADPIRINRVTMNYPNGSIPLVDEPVVYFPQPMTEAGDKINKQNIRFAIPNLDLDMPNKPVTMITRIRPDAFESSKYYRTVFDYDWGYKTRGFKFCVRNDGASWFYLAFYGVSDCLSTKEFQSNVGLWYDIGMVVEPNQPEAGKTRVIWYLVKEFVPTSDGYANGNVVQVMTNVMSGVSAAASAPASRYVKIGGSSGSSAYESGNNRDGQYRGAINFVKLYNRALTVEEFTQACAPSTDPLWSIGSKNSSDAEFSDADPATVFEPASMEWSRFRKTLDGEHPSVSILYNLTKDDLDVPRVLEIEPKTCALSANDSLQIEVNGNVIKRVSPEEGKTAAVFVRASALKQIVKVGDVYPLTITIRLVGSGTFTFDRVMLGSGFQLGAVDEKSTEFMGWSAKQYTSAQVTYSYMKNGYYLARNDISYFWGGTYAGNANQRANVLNFSISDFAAENCSFVYRARYLGNYGKMNYYLNGELYTTREDSFKANVEFAFPKGTLKPGINTLKIDFETNGASGAMNLDYLRLTPVKEWHDEGMLLLFR